MFRDLTTPMFGACTPPGGPPAPGIMEHKTTQVNTGMIIVMSCAMVVVLLRLVGLDALEASDVEPSLPWEATSLLWGS